MNTNISINIYFSNVQMVQKKNKNRKSANLFFTITTACIFRQHRPYLVQLIIRFLDYVVLWRVLQELSQ